jgi:hypothetical protein
VHTISQPAVMKLSPIHTKRMAQPPDPAILRIMRALARQAAREDHARETESIPEQVNEG